MAVHYFHCTDGTDLIVDRAGRESGAEADLVGRARAVADEVRRAVPAYADWEDWAVHVYDERGEVAIVPFEDARARAGRALPANSAAARVRTSPP